MQVSSVFQNLFRRRSRHAPPPSGKRHIGTNYRNGGPSPPHGCDRINASNAGRVITSHCCGSRYLPAGLVVSRESSHINASGSRVRNPEVGSAIKHRPSGFNTRKTSRTMPSLSGTIKNSRETTMQSIGPRLIRQRMRIRMLKRAVRKPHTRRPRRRPHNQAPRKVHPCGPQRGHLARKLAGIETRPTPKLQQPRPDRGPLNREQRPHNLLRMIAKQVLTAQRVKPREPFKQAVVLRKALGPAFRSRAAPSFNPCLRNHFPQSVPRDRPQTKSTVSVAASTHISPIQHHLARVPRPHRIEPILILAPVQPMRNHRRKYPARFPASPSSCTRFHTFPGRRFPAASTD